MKPYFFTISFRPEIHLRRLRNIDKVVFRTGKIPIVLQMFSHKTIVRTLNDDKKNDALFIETRDFPTNSTYREKGIVGFTHFHFVWSFGSFWVNESNF